MVYHLTGALNALFFTIALVGIGHQLATIRRRRLAGLVAASDALSLNQLGVSFFAYWAFFLYGYWVEPFNPYLVWPRLAGASLVFLVIAEVARDRQGPGSRLAATVAALFLIAGLAGLVAGIRVPEAWLAFPQLLSIVVTVLVVQSFAHQIAEVRKKGSPGAVSPWMHLGTFVKDGSLLAFGVAMGQRTGWPLVVMASSSMTIKLVLIWHLRSAFSRSVSGGAT